VAARFNLIDARLAGAIVGLLLALPLPDALAASAHASMPLGFTVQNPQPRPDLEARMLQWVNAERKAKGLGALRADPELTKVARAHSRDMLARGYFAHMTPEGKDPFERMRQAKVKYLTAGENLAFAPTLAQAQEALMNSSEHRANILRPAFGRVGIGIMEGGHRGEMVTQVFRN
jgi:uncharacterized protein YkwD